MKILLLVSVPVFWTAGSVFATPEDGAAFALHRKGTTTKQTTVCTSYTPNAALIPCWDYTTFAPVGQYSLVYMVIGQAPATGVSGASFGIDYEGRYGQGNGLDPAFMWFTECFDGSATYYDGGFGEFPAPKGGAVVTWQTCVSQDLAGFGVHAIIGALRCYTYADDVLRLTPNTARSSQPELIVVACDGEETDLVQRFRPEILTLYLGRVGFGSLGNQGYAGCIRPDPTHPATWGRIKTLYTSP